MKKALLFATALAGFTAVQAQDKTTLDLLVKKGYITQAEADSALATAAKPAAPAAAKVEPKNPAAVEKITISGIFQGRYTYINQNEKGPGLANPHDLSAFGVRRAILTFEANLGEGWKVILAPEMDGVPAGGTATNTHQFYLDRALVQYDCSAGSASAGLRRVNFGLEEYGSAATALVVERSAATIFSSTNNFGSRHTGVYWDGEVKDSGFFYGAAVTNSQVNVNAPTTTVNELAFWANAGFDFVCPVTKGKAKAGINLGYIAEPGTLAPAPASSLDGYDLGSAFGYNPYLTLTAGQATFTAEVLGWETNGNKASKNVSTFGYNLTGAYKVTEKFEPVVRFSHLRTGELGMTDLAAVNGYTDTREYTEVTSLYGGVNYYIKGNNLKVQAGYEVSQLADSLLVGSQRDAHAIRVQIQAMF